MGAGYLLSQGAELSAIDAPIDRGRLGWSRRDESNVAFTRPTSGEGDLPAGDAHAYFRAWRSAEMRRRHWSNMVGPSPVPVVITDATGHIEFVNGAFSDVTGYAMEDILGRNVSVLSSGLALERAFHDLWRTLKAGNARHGEFQSRRKDGSIYWGAASISPIRDNSGADTHFICFIHDLTSLKEAEARSKALAERLHQSQKMEALGAMAGGIAHDFNNILAIIGGFAHAGLNDLEPGDPLREDLRNILMAVNRGKDLTRRILTFSRRSESAPRPIDLDRTILEGLKMVRMAIPHSIAIRTNCCGSPKIVLGDDTEWHQIITNLCMNAAQAIANRPGSIEIDLRHDFEIEGDCALPLPGPFIEVAVHDTGPGIAPDDLAHVFEPFFTTKHRGEGTGLGLTIVQSIVAKFGGRIKAENRPSGGTTIRITVPSLPKESVRAPLALAPSADLEPARSPSLLRRLLSAE